MNILKIILAMTSLISVSCTTTAHAQTKNDNDMKSVIVYFTHSGNTELAAKQVAEVTGAKMIRLLPEQPYSSEDVNWVNKQSRCTQEHPTGRSVRQLNRLTSILQRLIRYLSVSLSGGMKNRQ